MKTQGQKLYRLERWLVTLTLVAAVCAATDTYTPGDSNHSTAETSKQPLYVLVTGPYPDPNETVYDGGISLIPAVRLAFQQINQHPHILQNYSLELLEDESGCSMTLQHRVFYSFVRNRYYNQPHVLGIIGPACSDPTLAIAPLLARPEVNLLQIAPTATSPLIETLNNNNTTFTMISSTLASIDAVVELMKCNGWRDLGVFVDEPGTPAHRTIEMHISRLLYSKLGGYLFAVPLYTDDETHLYDYFKGNTDLRALPIVLVIASKQIVQKIMCLAYHLSLTYPPYQYIFIDKSSKDFLADITLHIHPMESKPFNLTCPEKIMAQVANSSILINYNLISDSEKLIAHSDLNYSTYRELYMEYFRQHLQEPKVQTILKTVYQETDKEDKDFLPSGIWENAYYDAGWALGLALDQLAKEEYNLQTLVGEDSGFTQLLIDKLLNVSFNGATGPVRFNSKTKSVDTSIVITQLSNVNGELTEVTLTNYEHRNLSCPTEFGFVTDAVERYIVQIHTSVGVVVILITCILVIIIALLQIAFFLWRQKASIKAASKRLTHLTFLGCYFFAATTIIYTVQQTFLPYKGIQVVYPSICSAILWCLMFGSSLILGTIFVKTWRLFILFKYFKRKSPGVLLTDTGLASFVMLFLLIDLALCIGWTVTSPWTITLQGRSLLTGVGELRLEAAPKCVCQNIECWLAGVTVYKGGITITLVILSVLNRKIHRKHFSHTRRVNALLYSLTAIYVIGFPLWFGLGDNEHEPLKFHVETRGYVPYLTICTITLSPMVLCTLLLFLPPVFPVLKTKLGIKEDVTFCKFNGKH